MSASNPDDPGTNGNIFPEGFEPEKGVRYLVHENVLTIIDDRPGDRSGGPLPPHLLEQLRRTRRRLEGLPEEEPPPPSLASS
jgi:hypothetical protein